MLTIVCALAILVWAGPALGAGATDIYFTDLGAGHLWATDANWDDPVDGSPDDPSDDNAWVGGGLTCILDSLGTPKRLKVGTDPTAYTNGNGDGTLEIVTGGHLDLTLGGAQWGGVGATGFGHGDGTLRMNGGTFTSCGFSVGHYDQTGLVEIQSGSTINATSLGYCGIGLANGRADEDDNSTTDGATATINQTGGTLNLLSVNSDANLAMGYTDSWRGCIHNSTGTYVISGGTLNNYGGSGQTTAGLVLGPKHNSDVARECSGVTGIFHVIGAWEDGVDNIKVNSFRMFRQDTDNDGILKCDIDGTDGIEKIIVANAAQFQGKLVVTLGSGAGTYTLMTYASATGDFDETNLPCGAIYDIGLTALTVTIPIVGDLDRNDDVDFDDFTTLRGNYGETIGATWEMGDVDCDGDVDFDDYTLLRGNYTGSAGAIPEPTTLALFAIGIGGFLMRRKKHALKVLVLAVCLCGMGALNAQAAVVNLSIEGGEGEWQAYASVVDGSEGICDFAIAVEGSAGLTVTGSLNVSPQGVDSAPSPAYFKSWGFCDMRADGTAGIGITGSQKAIYSGTNDPDQDDLVLQNVGQEVGSRTGTISGLTEWAAPVMLASGTYDGDVGLLTVSRHGAAGWTLLSTVGSWEGPGNLEFPGDVVSGEVFIPEPMTMTLLGIGLAGVLLRRRRR